MCDAVHRWGAKMCIQLIPGDGCLFSLGGEVPISSSDGLSTVFPPFVPSRAATREEIHTILNDYRRIRFLIESIQAVQEGAGVAALHIEHGSYENLWELSPPQPVSFDILNHQMDVCETIRKTVKIPVMSQGRFGVKPRLAEQVIADGKFDFIGLGRGLICDPEWANKVKAGQLQDVRPCIGCQMGCYGRMFTGKYLSCALNPEAGNEKTSKLNLQDPQTLVRNVCTPHVTGTHTWNITYHTAHLI